MQKSPHWEEILVGVGKAMIGDEKLQETNWNDQLRLPGDVPQCLA
jgi:hypothetical protein